MRPKHSGDSGQTAEVTGAELGGHAGSGDVVDAHYRTARSGVESPCDGLTGRTIRVLTSWAAIGKLSALSASIADRT